MSETSLVNFEESLKGIFDEIQFPGLENEEEMMMRRDSEIFSLDLIAENGAGGSIFPTNFNHKPANKGNMCKNHPSQMLKVFCNECKVSLCVLCVADHEGHSCVDMHQIASLARKELHALQEQMTEMEEHLMEKCNQQTAFQTKLESLDRKASRGLCRHRERLLQSLSMAFDTLENSRQASWEYMLAKLQSENSEITAKMEAIRTACRTICHLLLHGSAQETILKYLRHKDQIQSLIATESPTLLGESAVIKPAEWKFEPYELKIHVGTLVLTDSNHTKTIPSNPDFLVEDEDLSIQLNNAESRITSLEKELAKQRQITGELEDNLDQSENSKKKIEQKMKSLLETLTANIDNMTGHISTHNGAQLAVRGRRAEREERNATEQAADDLLAKLEAIETTIVDLIRNSKNMTAGKDAEIKDLKKSMDSLEEEKEMLEVERDNLHLRLSKAVGDAESKIDDLSQNLTHLQDIRDKENLDLGDRIQSLTDGMKMVVDERDNWKTRFEESEDLCKEYDEEMGKLREKLFSAENELKQQAQMADELRQSIMESQTEAQTASEKLQEAESKLSEVEENTSGIKNKMHELKEEVKKVTDEKSELQRRTETLDREVRIMKFLRAVGGEKKDKETPGGMMNGAPKNYTVRRAHYASGASFFSRR